MAMGMTQTASSISGPEMHSGAAEAGRFRDRLTPAQALAMSYVFWLLIFLISPVEPRWSGNITGYLLLFLGIAGLFVGISLPDGLRWRAAHIAFSERVCCNGILLCTLLGLLGLAFKLYDIFVLRGVSLDQDVIQARIASARAEASGISVLAAILLPFANAALLMAWYARRVGYSRKISLWVLAASLAPIGVPFLFGSRSGLVYFLLLIVVSYLNLTPRIRLRHIAFGLLGAFAALTLLALVFIDRTERSGINLLYAARLSAYTNVVPLQPWALDFIDNAGSYGPILAGYASLMQYVISGNFEFLYLVELKDSNFGFGGYLFFFVPKLLDILVNPLNTAAGQLQLEALNPRSGVFQGMFGGMFIDFGLLFPLFCVMLGAIAGYFRQQVLAGNIFAVPLYILILSQLLLASMLDSLSVNAAILSNFVLFGIFVVGSRFAVR